MSGDATEKDPRDVPALHGPLEARLLAIGYVECPELRVYEAARQGALAGGNEGAIVLYDDARGLRDGLDGLAGFERLWVIAELHLCQTWNARVHPPRPELGRLGVFATRAPHRPCRLGLTCVELTGVDVAEGRLSIRNHDLLHGTPVLDLKPYVPYADAFPEARAGWVDELALRRWEVSATEEAARRLAWLERHAGLVPRSFCQAQLATHPTDASRKRIVPLADGRHEIAYRTWRLRYRVDEAAGTVCVDEVASGYRADELADPSDPHRDKAAHRAFLDAFGAA